MATTKRARRHARETNLTDRQVMELLIGPGTRSAFRDEDERRAAWHSHREELMGLLPPDGRGWGWVAYEAGGFLPGEHGRVTVALRRLRLTEKNKKENRK